MVAFKPTEVMVVGPRTLPADGPVKVWIDLGSGPGRELLVRSEHLRLSVQDSGDGPTALYDLRVFFCRG
ncbi:hypothetical protein ACN27G_12910 [Plantactinospora sp. WMMB334]|uniref:hypothetical protein n=1 Tax=Plantactinospora sp. WMMB334 TaxID=3404119 RepID=UPI003B960741